MLSMGRENCHDPSLGGLNDKSEPLAWVNGMRGDSDSRAVEGALEKVFDLLLDLGGVRGKKAIVAEHQKFVGAELDRMERRFLFEKSSSRLRRRKHSCEAIGHRLFAIIDQSEPTFRLVHAEVAFVRNQENPGAILHVRVVMNVNEEMIADPLSLNP